MEKEIDNMTNMRRGLAHPFDAKDVHWRVGSVTRDKSKGMPLAFIDARNVMDRLDLVVGPQNWQREHRIEGEFIIARVGIKIDGDWVWKEDGADKTDVEKIKGGLSDAFKRAAVSWGIGRYLYELPNSWIPLKDGKYITKDEEKKLAQALTRWSDNWVNEHKTKEKEA